jgi:opacity protein-like surface antigen
MNKMVKTVAFIALTAVFSFSQEGNAIKYGARAAFNMNSFSTGDSKDDEDINMGLGFGIGGTVSIPITSSLTFNPELNFLYRNLFNVTEKDDDYEYEGGLSELALSVPVMVRFTPMAGTPFYISGGIQLDLPFSSEEYYEVSEDGESESGSKDFKDRRTLDFGIALGAGYQVMENLVADFRFVIGLTSLTGKSGDDTSFNQFGIGATYSF